MLEAIDDGLGRGQSPRQVHGALIHMARFDGRVPSLRTISRRAKERRPPAAGERWSLAEAEPDEAAAVLPVFAALAKRDRVWECGFVTKEHAQVLVLIRAAAPDLDPWVAYKVADEYVLRRRGGLRTLGLELGLALAPWRSEASAAELRRVLEAGFLGPDLSADIRQLERDSKDALRDPIADAVNRREERLDYDAAEDYWAGLTAEEREAEVQHQQEAAIELGLDESGSH
ncbi:MAG: hypothetical protein ABSD62_11255 [Candidatus Limnocylindrales bacterium]